MTDTKSTPIEAVYHTANLNKSQAAAAVEGALEIISGSSKFRTKDKNPGRGRSLPALRKKMNGSR